MELIEIKLPQSNVNDTTARIIEWRVADGEKVSIGQVILVIETSKSAEEIESPASGYIKILSQVDAEISVGETLAVIGASPEALSDIAIKSPEARPPEVAIKATADAKELAASHNIDLGVLKVRGIITKRHVENFIASIPKSSPIPPKTSGGRNVPLTKVQLASMEAVSSSTRETATTYVLGEADITNCMAALDSLIDDEGLLLSITDVAIHFCSRTLRNFPRLNARLAVDMVVEIPEINIGVAVEINGDLHFVVIPHADSLPVSIIGETRQESVFLLLKGQPLKNQQPSTFGVTVLDQPGITYQIPIVFPGHAAITGFGPIRESFTINSDGFPEKRKLIGICVSYDHRFINGTLAANFLSSLIKRLEEGTLN
ncbi:MAG: 2-oxo acid dehydrogenase subunit E2 [Gallionella sp.]|nr:2-oxo acid dehydrogenase subunit E2 [Gallionella sp.]